MGDFEKIWHNQCEAARGIRERFGLERALRYLVGEKYADFLVAADTHPDFAAELDGFTAEVRSLFEPHEIAAFLNGSEGGGSGRAGEDGGALARPDVVARLKAMLLP